MGHILDAAIVIDSPLGAWCRLGIKTTLHLEAILKSNWMGNAVGLQFSGKNFDRRLL